MAIKGSHSTVSIVVQLFLVYVLVLVVFSLFYRKSFGKISSYSIGGDMKMLLQDNVMFDRQLTRESLRKNLQTDLERCEWTLEKLKDMFQFYAVADNSVWPYQVMLSMIGTLIIGNLTQTRLDTSKALGVAFAIFLLIDLPRRFLSFHKAAGVTNKALNAYTFYYRFLKGKNFDVKKFYNL